MTISEKYLFEEETEKAHEINCLVYMQNRETLEDLERAREGMDLARQSGGYDCLDGFPDERRKFERKQKELEPYYQICEEPYFGRIFYTAGTSDYQKRDVYIGKRMVDDGETPIIINWTNRLAGLYYKNYSFVKIDDVIHTPDSIRSIRINHWRLEAVTAKSFVPNTRYINSDKDGHDKESSKEVIDSFLLDIITQNRRKFELTDIIATIQADQYEIIELKPNRNFIVQGCAGSGKTMVMLHRISWLLSNYTLKAEKISVLTPGIKFNKFVSGLKENLELSKIHFMSGIRFCNSLILSLDPKISLDPVSNEDIGKVKQLNQILTVKSLKALKKSYNRIVLATKNNAVSILQSIPENVYGLMPMNNLKYYIENPETYQKVAFEEEIFRDITALESLLSCKSPSIIFETKAFKELRNAKNAEDKAVINYQKSRWMLLEKLSEPNQSSKQFTTASQIEDLEKFWERLSKNPELKIDDSMKCTFYPKKLKTAKKLLTEYRTSRKSLLEAKQRTKQADTCYKDELANRYSARYSAIGVPEKVVRETIKKLKSIRDDISISSIFKEVVSDYVRSRGIKAEGILYENTFIGRIILLYFCFLQYGKVRFAPDLLCIDEAQSYSPLFYKVLKEVLPEKTVWNIYGDVGQSTGASGISNWDQISFFNSKEFSLNYNYRNTIQITNYTNQDTNRMMNAIGLNGPQVQKISITKGLDLFQDLFLKNPNERFAIICLNQTLKQKMVQETIKYNTLKNCYENHKIDILTVFEAKGLEFENVLVDRQGMDENERYISFTRALSRLFVIDSEH